MSKRSVTHNGIVGGIVSCIRVETDGGPHARVSVWNRGALAGVLMVAARDAEVIMGRLLDGDPFAPDDPENDPASYIDDEPSGGPP
jgi:hypothetical protein